MSDTSMDETAAYVSLHMRKDTESSRREYEFSLRVVPDPLGELILQGMYDLANIPDAGFPEAPVRGPYEVNACVLPYPQKACVEKIAQTFSKEGYRFGTFRELLALGMRYPDLQRDRPIEAIADFLQCNDGRFVPRLGGTETYRTLSIHWVGARRDDDTSFLMVRTLSHVL